MESLTWEEFNHHIDNDEPECSMCFSFGHLKPLDEVNRRLRYLEFGEQEEARQELLISELDRRVKDPIDDNIYYLVIAAELIKPVNLELRDRIMLRVLQRATEMSNKKMPNAWCAVRVYGWMENNDPLFLIDFLKESEDPLVRQVCMQCLQSFSLLYKEIQKCGSVSYIRDQVYRYALAYVREPHHDGKHLALCYNAVQAMLSLQDERVLDVIGLFPQKKLGIHHFIQDHIERQINYLNKLGDVKFLPILQQLQQ